MASRVKLFIIGTCAVLGIAGCSSSGGDSPPSAPSTTTAQRYLSSLHSMQVGEGGFDAYSDDDLLTTGRSVCQMLKHPTDHPYGPANDLISQGWNALPAAALVRAAELTLCINGS